jgi:hypothetical protein
VGLKGCRGLQDRRALERRVAVLETHRRRLIAARPGIVARAWAAARAYDQGQPLAVGQQLVEAACGPDPGVVDVVDCLCPGCTTKVPVTWESGLCSPCINEDCEHPVVGFE